MCSFAYPVSHTLLPLSPHTLVASFPNSINENLNRTSKYKHLNIYRERERERERREDGGERGEGRERKEKGKQRERQLHTNTNSMSQRIDTVDESNQQVGTLEKVGFLSSSE